ncbi:MAG: hypothetical protein EOP82_14385, partial [Variovorax sp.]
MAAEGAAHTIVAAVIGAVATISVGAIQYFAVVNPLKDKVERLEAGLPASAVRNAGNAGQDRDAALLRATAAETKLATATATVSELQAERSKLVARAEAAEARVPAGMSFSAENAFTSFLWATANESVTQEECKSRAYEGMNGFKDAVKRVDAPSALSFSVGQYFYMVFCASGAIAVTGLGPPGDSHRRTVSPNIDYL